jgi:NADH:ubiquinone oxidoreductase 24 kD subunit
MRLLQAERGWLDDTAIRDAAAITGLSPTEVEELASFYSLIFRRPVGRHILQVCDSICCAMQGAQSHLAYLRQLLGAEEGTPALDGRLTVLPNICLGLCDKAPAALLDGEPVAPVSNVKLDEILARLEQEKP